METVHNTPFKLPLWSGWTVQTSNEGSDSFCCKCHSTTTPLKILAIQSILRHIKLINRSQDLVKLLRDSLIPPVLYIDVARQLFAAKQWSSLRSLVSHWPFESFQLSQICNETCPQCWLSYLESEDVDDPEKEGGDTERQLFRKVFKHVLDGYFFVVKGTLENGEGGDSPLRVLDLTLDPSQDIRGFLWEEEFRRLGRRITKTLDVCVLAGMHKKKGRSTNKPQVRSSPIPDSSPMDYERVVSHWLPVKEAKQNVMEQQKEEVATTDETKFEISTWGDELANSSTWGGEFVCPSTANESDQPSETISTFQDGNHSPEIGVWNGNALDLSHLDEMPIFRINIDAAISEKSVDILTWIQHRYDDFAPSESPLSVAIRFLEVSLHEERKFDSLISRLPEHIHGLQLSEICERRSAQILSSQLSRFSDVRFLDFGACAFDLADQPEVVFSLAFALSQLPRLERLSLAHNCLTGCLAELLGSLQHGLKLLDLSSCYLNDDDLAFLGESAHRTTLRSLSLASNDLGIHWDRLQSLVNQLGGYGSNLRILDLSSNEFVESQLTTLCRAMLGPLSSLTLLDLSWHQLSLTSIISVVELLASKTSLRTFCLSTPMDMDECGYGQPESWQAFVDFFRGLTAKHRGDSGDYGHPPLTLHWCLM